MNKIILTKHARERIIERVGCRGDKCEKIARKAIASKEVIRDDFIRKREYNGYKGVFYRLFHGCAFVFYPFDDDFVLITVLIYEKCRNRKIAITSL